MKRIISMSPAILSLLLGVMAVACSDKKGDDDIEPGYGGRTTALVTYEGTQDVQYGEETGYVSLFTYYGEDGMESRCRSTVETRLPQTLDKGQRMVIAYTNTVEHYPSYPMGPLNVMSYVLVPTVHVKNVSHEEAVANNAEMCLFYENGKVSMYRTGYYINLNIYMPNYTGRKYTLYADEETVGTEMPELYLSTEAKGEGQGYVSKTLISLNITDVWRDATVLGVKLHVNNTGGDEQKIFRIMKY